MPRLESLKDQPKFRKEEPYVKKLIFVTILCTLVWLGLIGCSDDCATCPEPKCSDCPYDGRLYVAMDSPNPGVYIFDTKTDSLVDSIVFSSTTLATSLSPNGRYFTGSNDRGTISLFDAGTGRLISELSGFGKGEFGKNSSMLLVRNRSGTDVFSLPSVTLSYSGSAIPIFARQVSDQLRFYGLWTSDTLALFDVDSSNVLRKWQIKIAERRQLMQFDVSADGSKLYGIANTSDGDLFYAYDLVGDSVLSTFRLLFYLGDVRIHPSGREVWVCDPGSPLSYPWPDQIYVFDTQTGRLLYSISLRQEVNPIGVTPDVYGIEFTPDGSAAYLRSGHDLSYSGTVLKIDCRSKKVTKVLFPHWDRYPRSMAIGPRLDSQ
jgi:WD40 repeat protein